LLQVVQRRPRDVNRVASICRVDCVAGQRLLRQQCDCALGAIPRRRRMQELSFGCSDTEREHDGSRHFPLDPPKLETSILWSRQPTLRYQMCDRRRIVCAPQSNALRPVDGDPLGDIRIIRITREISLHHRATGGVKLVAHVAVEVNVVDHLCRSLAEAASSPIKRRSCSRPSDGRDIIVPSKIPSTSATFPVT
jgi:hypothetical protein